MIKHLSFDLWLTLIKSNPLFKQQRAELIAKQYNPANASVDAVFHIIQCIDRASDRWNEITGNKLPTERMYHAILKRLGYQTSFINNTLLTDIKQQVNELFYKYPPCLLNSNIHVMLAELKNEGYSMNISSNTGFIEGCYVQIVLSMLQIDQYFNFTIYSDQINASKPSSQFFEAVFARVKCKKHQVLHIGDNPKADVAGAKDFGFLALLIENRNYSLDFIRTCIDEKNRELQCI